MKWLKKRLALSTSLMDSPHFELSFGDHPDDDLHWAKEKGGNNSGGRRGYYLVVLLGSFGVAKH